MPRPAIRPEPRSGSGNTAINSASYPAGLPGAPCGPIDNTWDNGILDDLPDPVTEAAAVWTGSLMVIWGGRSESNYRITGGRYDPATDTWTPTSTTNAPSRRFGIFCENRMSRKNDPKYQSIRRGRHGQFRPCPDGMRSGLARQFTR